MASKRSFRSLMFMLVVLMAGMSAFQYTTDGVITWHRQPLESLEQLVVDAGERLERTGDFPFILPGGEQTESAPTVDPAGGEAAPASYRDAGEPDLSRFELVGQVTEVIDGDSVEIQVDGSTYTVRLFGIDTPEHGQSHGNVAARALSRKLDRRQVGVNIEDIDSYGRLVGTVYYRGENVNLSMVAEGHGWWYRQYAPANHALRDAEAAAREAGLGLWASPAPVAPWEWRRRN